MVKNYEKWDGELIHLSFWGVSYVQCLHRFSPFNCYFSVVSLKRRKGNVPVSKVMVLVELPGLLPSGMVVGMLTHMVVSRSSGARSGDTCWAGVNRWKSGIPPDSPVDTERPGTNTSNNKITYRAVFGGMCGPPPQNELANHLPLIWASFKIELGMGVGGWI